MQFIVHETTTSAAAAAVIVYTRAVVESSFCWMRTDDGNTAARCSNCASACTSIDYKRTGIQTLRNDWNSFVHGRLKKSFA